MSSDGTSYSSSRTASSSEGMSSNTQHSSSTPLKAKSHPGQRLLATEERAYIDQPKPDLQFVQDCFVPPDKVPDFEDESIPPLLEAVLSAGNEKEMYSKLQEIFEKIAQFLCATGHVSSRALLQFICSPTKGPSGTSRKQTNAIAPDINVLLPVAVSEKFLQRAPSDDSFRTPWAILVSCVEVKLGDVWKGSQALDYIETILEHQPDKLKVLGMSCNEKGYRFYYHDACTQKASVVFSWDTKLEKLVHFIYSLHQIYANDRDTSIWLHDIVWRKNDTFPPVWRVSFKGNEYSVQPIFQRKGPGRRTWIAVGTDRGALTSKSTSIRVVKDMWTDKSRRYEEGSLLDMIHKDGFIPGVVRPVSCGALDGLTIGNRTKHRLVMGSTGLRLSECKSVLEFLKVIYDAIEAHERVMERGVLHRDISWYNVLCKPQHYIGNDNVVNQPNIGKILGKPDSQPLCLLTDFDNAALTEDDRDPAEGTQRTGTPMFMACELEYGKMGYIYLKPEPIDLLSTLLLENDALEHYTGVYGRKRYDDFNNFILSVTSGAVAEVDPFSAGNNYPAHRSHHDIESFFWIILWFVVKAWPTDSDPFPGIDGEYQIAIIKDIYSRRKLMHDKRAIVNILKETEDTFCVLLHPYCHPLAKMLSDMARYLRMRWSRFPCMPYWHPHEAFKRLLLKEIIRMTKDNSPIPIQGPRPSIKKYEKIMNLGTSVANLTPSGSRSNTFTTSTSSRLRGSLGSSPKRARSNSISADSGNVAKKKRSNKLLEEPVCASGDVGEIEGDDDDFVREYLENMEKDENMWMTE